MLARDPEQLSAAQPERRRDYVQLAAGVFRGELREWSSGSVALGHERWSCSVRVRCDRPRSYVAFAVVCSSAPTSMCAIELPPSAVFVVERDWELSSQGALESLSFAVERERLERNEAWLGYETPDARASCNRLLAECPEAAASLLLRRRLASALRAGPLLPVAQRALEDDLLRLAARLRRAGRLERTRLEPASRRRTAVRTVEEYLDAHEREVPSLAELCSAARVSERTLEYAFREQIGTTPTRYLRLRRLCRARGELLRSDPASTRVTDVAMRWGFWELGRFALEYRRHFGERPSQTLARGPRAEAPLRNAG